MKLTIDQIEEISERLQGQCMEGLSDVLEDMGLPEESELDGDDFDEIDMRVQNCEQCGWWVESHEMGESYCNDCESSINEEE